MTRITLLFAGLLAALLSACGGGGSAPAATAPATGISSSPTPAPGTAVQPGTTHLMAAGETVLVPAGTVVTTPLNSVINVMGESNTVNVPAGTTVAVPASATGPASNKVVAGAAVTALTASVELLAGGGAISESVSRDGSGDQARFQGIYELAIDSSGNLYAADRDSVRRITPAGVVSTLSSSPVARWSGLALDRSGNLLGNDILSDTIYRRGGDGVLQAWASGWNGGKSLGGQLAADAAGNLYLADYAGRRILKFNAAGAMSVLAGGGAGDGNDGVGTQAAFHGPSALALDGNGALLVNDSDAVRKVLPDGTVTTLARIPKRIIPVDGPIAIDAAGNAYVANDSDLRRVAPDGTVSVLRLASGSMPYILTMVADRQGYLYAGTGWASPAQVWKIKLP